MSDLLDDLMKTQFRRLHPTCPGQEQWSNGLLIRIECQTPEAHRGRPPAQQTNVISRAAAPDGAGPAQSACRGNPAVELAELKNLRAEYLRRITTTVLDHAALEQVPAYLMVQDRDKVRWCKTKPGGMWSNGFGSRRSTASLLTNHGPVTGP